MIPDPVIPELLAAAIAREGPLRIDKVEHYDPVVTFSGTNWSLGLLCRWRLVHDNALVVDSDDDAVDDYETVASEIVSDHLWNLVGQSIIGARPSAKNPNDPILFLTGSYAIEIEADTDLDPWVFHLPGDIFVGVMT